MVQTASNAQIDNLVGKVVEEYFQRLDRGEQPRLDEFVERYPEIGDLLRTVIPVLQAAEQTSGASSKGAVATEHQKQLGDFRILRQIGRGGMGIVYEAEQISMQRRVALKVLPLAGLCDDLMIRRFQNEVRAVAALDHPNIVSVYTVGEERGVHYYAMRLIRGRNLSEVIASLRHVRDEGNGLDGSTMSRISRMGRVDEVATVDYGATADFDASRELVDGGSMQEAHPEPVNTVGKADSSTIPHSSRCEYFRSVAALGIQVASALQHAHDAGIIHRDIKPANLLLDSSSKLHLTDFGLARIEADAGMTMTGDLIGTLCYMAPEQALAKRVVVDHRADIYSLAATLYELLTLRPAYLAEDRQQLLKKIAFEEPTPLRRVDRDVPVELETIVHKAMSKDMDQRYSSAQEFADDLRAHLENRPIKAKPPTFAETIGKWTRRNPILTWASMISLMLVTITLAASTLLIANQRDIAEERLVRATTAELQARKARNEAASQASNLARRNYLLHVANADNALLKRKYLRAQVELDACPQEQRGREWHYLEECMQAAFPLTLPGSEQPIFTHDGKRLIAIGEYDTPGHRMVKTWDLESGKVVGDRIEHDSPLGQIAVSTNEKRIAGGDYTGNLFVWDAESGTQLWSANKVHEGRCNGLAFSPDGLLVASANFDGRLVVVDAKNGQKRFSHGPFKSSTRKVMFSPDGRWIASGLGKGKGPAMLIDAATGEIVAKFSAEGGDVVPTFAPSGQRIVTGNVDGSLKVWNWDGEQLVKIDSWPGAGGEIQSIRFNTDGTRLVATNLRPCAVTVWDATKGEKLDTLDTTDIVYWSAFSRSGDEIALFSVSGGIRIWRWRGREDGLKVKALNGAVKAMFSPDGKSILASTPMYFFGGGSRKRGHHFRPESAVILSAESGAEILAIDEALYAASWSPDGREIIATLGSDDAIRAYAVATGERLRTFPDHTPRFTISRLDPSSQRLVCFSADRTMRVLNFKSGEEDVVQHITQGAGVMGANFSPAANLIAFGIAFRTEVWDTRSATRVSSHTSPGHWVKRFVFSADGRRLYVGGHGGLLMELDTASGQKTKRFVGHVGRVLGIALSPDEGQIVSGDDSSGQVIIWDVASQQPLVTLTDRGPGITSLDWSSDGRRIVAGKGDGTVQIWTLSGAP